MRGSKTCAQSLRDCEQPRNECRGGFETRPCALRASVKSRLFDGVKLRGAALLQVAELQDTGAKLRQPARIA